ncbi:MAG: cell division protein SepF [Clostridiales bacterium]|nr:cell division protein SepF [Clostridiales bacterium]
MGFMDELKRLARPYEDEEEEAAEEPNNTTSMEEERSRRAADQTPEEPEYVPFTAPAQENSNKVVTMNTTTQLKVVLVKPTQFEDASAIADHLRDKRTVVLNLEATGKDIARRLLDFLSGVAYAQEGKIKKVAQSTYIITPYNVDIVGDLLDELEKNSGMYF